MDELRQRLALLAGIDGVQAAIAVSRDGFILEAATSGELDTEAVGAIVSTGVSVTENIGNDLNLGTMRQCMLEYGNGLVLISLLGNDAILAVTAGAGINLGHIRLQVRRAASDIARLL